MTTPAAGAASPRIIHPSLHRPKHREPTGGPPPRRWSICFKKRVCRPIGSPWASLSTDADFWPPRPTAKSPGRRKGRFKRKAAEIAPFRLETTAISIGSAKRAAGSAPGTTRRRTLGSFHPTAKSSSVMTMPNRSRSRPSGQCRKASAASAFGKSRPIGCRTGRTSCKRPRTRRGKQSSARRLRRRQHFRQQALLVLIDDPHAPRAAAILFENEFGECGKPIAGNQNILHVMVLQHL